MNGHFSMAERDRLGVGCDVSPAETWCIIRTAARCEKIVARRLQACGIPHYLPLRTVRRQYGSETFNVQLPLFDRYVFARGPMEALRFSDNTNSIRDVYSVSDQLHFQSELDNLAQALANEVQLEPQTRLANGIRVEVCDGTLKGLQGIISCLNRAEQLVSQVDHVGQAYGTAIDGHALKVLNA
jgi:transcription antitermination factor NusG